MLAYPGWGYRLAAERGSHDATLFTRYAALGRRALTEGDNGRPSAVLRKTPAC